MSQQNPLELAKQGNPSAIAALINRNLKPKGVTAKVSRNGRCLKVILESNKVLNHESLIEFIHRGILKLEIDEIDILQILGKQVDDKIPSWTQTVNLKPSHSEDIAPQRSKDESDRQILSKGKVIQPKKATKSYWKLIALSIFTVGFVGWLLTTEEYQMTMEEMPFSQAFRQLMSSLFDSSPDNSSKVQSLSNCEKAIEAAAAVSNMQDAVEDIDPAIRICESMDELVSASSKFPAALDGVDEATYVANRCNFNSSLKNTPICSSLLPTLNTINYLAINSERPAPEDPVPVSDKETIEALVAAAQSENREVYDSIIASPSVALMPGGSTVNIVSTSGDLVQVDLMSRDIKGNDLSEQVLWTYSRFVQNTQM
jgi:hypothetical protein